MATPKLEAQMRLALAGHDKVALRSAIEQSKGVKGVSQLRKKCFNRLRKLDGDCGYRSNGSHSSRDHQHNSVRQMGAPEDPLQWRIVRRTDCVRAHAAVSLAITGWFIGHRGSNITRFKDKTGCDIWVDNDTTELRVSGSTEAEVVNATNVLSNYWRNAPQHILDELRNKEVLTESMECPHHLQTLLTSSIPYIKKESGAYTVFMNQSEAVVRVTGTARAVEVAIQVIDRLFAQAGAKPLVRRSSHSSVTSATSAFSNTPDSSVAVSPAVKPHVVTAELAGPGTLGFSYASVANPKVPTRIHEKAQAMAPQHLGGLPDLTVSPASVDTPFTFFSPPPGCSSSTLPSPLEQLERVYHFHSIAEDPTTSLEPSPVPPLSINPSVPNETVVYIPQAATEGGNGKGQTVVASWQHEGGVNDLLQSLNLMKYSTILEEQEVDMEGLMTMQEHDYTELGIPMGPRKKIMNALGRLHQLCAPISR